jgi:hypothetical protein
MTARAEDDPPPEAGRLPTGRLARTARVGGLVTGGVAAQGSHPSVGAWVVGTGPRRAGPRPRRS